MRPSAWPEIIFPTFAFPINGDVALLEGPAELEYCGYEFDPQTHVGMLLVDARLHSWTISSVSPAGRGRAYRRGLEFAAPIRLSHVFKCLPDTSLHDLKELACRAIAVRPEDWTHFGAPDEIAAVQEQIRGLATAPELAKWIGPRWFD